MEEVKAVKPQQPQTRPRAVASYAYFDFDDSLTVAKVMKEMQGGSCTPDQLAQWLDYKSTKSGTFYARLSSAKQFGLVRADGGMLHITDRAIAILAPVMPEDAVSARADAFLAVELYGLIYEKYKGTTIPPKVGVRNLLMTPAFGVSEESVDRAVRVMFESAAQTGMFNNGDDTRLVRPGIRSGSTKTAVTEPPISPTSSPPQPPQSPDHIRHGGGGDGGPPTGVHTAIVGLLRELPPPGSKWAKKSKDRFVKAFLATLDFVYESDDEAEATR